MTPETQPKSPSRALLLWFLATMILPLISGAVCNISYGAGEETVIPFSALIAIPLIVTAMILLSRSSAQIAGQKRPLLEFMLLLGGLFVVIGMLSTGCLLRIY